MEKDRRGSHNGEETRVMDRTKDDEKGFEFLRGKENCWRYKRNG